MWVKTTCCNRLYLPFKIRNFFLQFFVLVQSYTSTQASTCRRLQPSLVLQLLLEGSYNPLALVLADMYQYVGASLQKPPTVSFLLGTAFHKFSDWIHQQLHSIICINQSPFAPTKTKPTNHFDKSSKCCNQNTVTKIQ